MDIGERYAGEYISGRRNFTSYTRILGLLDSISVEYDRVPDLLRVTQASGEKEYRLLHVRGAVSDGTACAE